MAEGGDTFPDTELQRLARGVCLIEIPLLDSSGKTYIERGTGFHYGNGWVMSVAHNFQNEKKDDATTHSLISKATFTFITEGDAEVDVPGSTYVKKLKRTPKDEKEAHQVKEGDAEVDVPGSTYVKKLKRTPKDEKEAHQDERQNGDNQVDKQKENKTYVVFKPRKRAAFIHHLRTFKAMPDGSRPETTKDEEDDCWTDWTNEDIAMIKLGYQAEWGSWDIGESCYSKWEKEEQKVLDCCIKTKDGPKLLLPPFREFDPPEPEKDQTVFAFHFGGNDDNEKIVKSTITELIDGTTYKDGSVKNVPMLSIDKPAGTCLFPEGASGCPIMIKDSGGKYRLVGLHFIGTVDHEAGTAEALRWVKGIQDHIGDKSGVIIVMLAERYMYLIHRQTCTKCSKRQEWIQDGKEADRKEEWGNELIELARKNNLTIYLSNGKLFKWNYQGRK